MGFEQRKAGRSARTQSTFEECQGGIQSGWQIAGLRELGWSDQVVGLGVESSSRRDTRARIRQRCLRRSLFSGRPLVGGRSAQWVAILVIVCDAASRIATASIA